MTGRNRTIEGRRLCGDILVAWLYFVNLIFSILRILSARLLIAPDWN